MITNSKAIHMLEVARKCYGIAKEKGLSEQDCQAAFLMGWCHDIGYEFHPGMGHAKESANILSTIEKPNIFNAIQKAIENHGNPKSDYNETFSEIINLADLQVDATGSVVTPQERIVDIGCRYGFDSEQYENAFEIYTHLFP